MLGYLSADIICSEWRTVIRERSSRKTVSYKEQIMSKDKYPSIFLLQMEAIVFIILQIFYATRAVLKIGEYPRIFPSFSWGIFTHVTRLDQSRASENIWWIIMWISHRKEIRELTFRALALRRSESDSLRRTFWIRSDEGLTLETSAFESLYGG